jgi:hypothetical protein
MARSRAPNSFYSVSTWLFYIVLWLRQDPVASQPRAAHNNNTTIGTVLRRRTWVFIMACSLLRERYSMHM